MPLREVFPAEKTGGWRMTKQEKSIYDKAYYLSRIDVQLSKKTRQKALIILSHLYPKEFARLYKRELRRVFTNLKQPRKEKIK